MAGATSAETGALAERLRKSEIPEEVAKGLARLCAELQDAAGAHLAGVILYGGVARGRYRPEKSDIDLAVLLHDASAPVLKKIGPVLHRAWQSQRVEALVLNLSDVSSLASAFPVTILDIQEQHICLWGSDPFQGLKPPLENLRKRIAQELWNLNLRLRRRYLFVTADLDEQWRILSEIARPLAIELNWMLYLQGQHLSDNDRTAAIFDLASEVFQLDRQVLAELAILRQTTKSIPPSDLYSRVLGIVDRCAHLVNEISVPA